MAKAVQLFQQVACQNVSFTIRSMSHFNGVLHTRPLIKRKYL